MFDRGTLARLQLYERLYINLGTLGGAYSLAWAINNSGPFVGTSSNGQGVFRAFILCDGYMNDMEIS